jgi:hypothetical protein
MENISSEEPKNASFEVIEFSELASPVYLDFIQE